MKIAVVQFPGSDRSYDYLDPFGCQPGDTVIVMTRRGEAEVSVTEIKDASDRATASIVRRVEKTLL